MSSFVHHLLHVSDELAARSSNKSYLIYVVRFIGSRALHSVIHLSPERNKETLNSYLACVRKDKYSNPLKLEHDKLCRTLYIYFSLLLLFFIYDVDEFF